MKKIGFVCLVALVGLSSCIHFNTRSVHGDGTLTTRDRHTKSFDRIQSFGSFDVKISRGEIPSVKIEADENLQQYIEAVVEDNTLNIRQRKNYNIDSDHGVTIFIVAPLLNGVNSFGSGNIISEDEMPSSGELEIESHGSGDITYHLKAESLNAEVSGSGNLEFRGAATEMEAGISGSGNIRAVDLETNNASIHIAGSGNADVNAKEKLDVNIAGSGDVHYIGSPEVSQHIAGSGSVSREN